MDLTGKIAVVTGGANGIGLSIAEEFMNAGAAVAVIDKSERPAPCDMYYCGDIAHEDVLVSFVKEFAAKFGRIDFLINNACLSMGGILSGCSYEDFLYVQRAGVAAPYMLTMLLLPYFTENAAIVNISSTRALQSQPDTESYTAAKGGISALTHALSVSLSGKVRVNSISPGWIDTTGGSFPDNDHKQHPAGRIGVPMDIARAALFLCGTDSSFITGQNITIDGGMSGLMVYNGDNGWSYGVQEL